MCVAVALDRADVLCQHADGGDAVRAPDRPGGGLDRVSVPTRALGLSFAHCIEDSLSLNDTIALRSFGAAHTYGSKGINEKPVRRKSL